jgi:hypothetical protein
MAPLQRTGTMSTKKELLKQIRDAVNPGQRRQNQVAMLQAALSVAGIIVLIVFVGLMYGTLENTKHVTGALDEQMAITLSLMQNMSASLNTTESFLGYLSVLPGMVDNMETMKTNIAISTDAMGCSAIFGGGAKPECQA